MKIPDFQDVLMARRQIAPYLQRTPMHSYPAIDELIGARVLIKHENHQPVCAFKVRGGVNLVSQLSDEERARDDVDDRASTLSRRSCRSSVACSSLPDAR